jgi:hypothetical protein
VNDVVINSNVEVLGEVEIPGTKHVLYYSNVVAVDGDNFSYFQRAGLPVAFHGDTIQLCLRVKNHPVVSSVAACINCETAFSYALYLHLALRLLMAVPLLHSEDTLRLRWSTVTMVN